jgi:hypothetical protein
MKLKLNVLATAAAFTLASAAQATLTLPNTGSLGNSSAVFVAINNDLNTSLTVDLGVKMADFLNAPSFTASVGALADPAGVTASWNLGGNTRSVNGSAVTGNYAWATQASNFFATAGANYKWGVFAADSVNTGAPATNLISGGNIMFTTSFFDPANDLGTGTTPSSVTNGAGAITQFMVASNGKGTHTAGTTGANVATSGVEFVGTAMVDGTGVGNFNQQLGTNDFLSAPGATAFFAWANNGSGSTSRVFSIGVPNAEAAESPFPATWSWDQTSNTLTYVAAPVPEPGTYALLLAGIAVVGSMARRRMAP